MEKNTFYVFEYKNLATGKCYAIPEKICNCNNLVSYFKAPKGYDLLSVNACDTWKEAQNIASYWNEGYQGRGIYEYA